MSDAYVYFIQADENGPIKIGFTSGDPKDRLSQLQTGNPSILKLLGAIKGTTQRERQLHNDLAEWRLQGEWFQSHPTVLATIEEAMAVPAEPINCGGPYCSFCGICKHDAAVLVAGPDETYICEQCVGVCAKIVAEHFVKAANDIAATPRPEMECGA